MNGGVQAITWFGAIGSALMAGVFFIFSITIMRSLDKLPPAQGIVAMQHINRTIVGPAFMLAFVGTGIAAVVLGGRSLRHLDVTADRWLLAAAVLYVGGVWIVTGAFNVPRNNALDALDPSAAESVEAWSTYVREWTAWNHVRTVASIATVVAFIQALRIS